MKKTILIFLVLQLNLYSQTIVKIDNFMDNGDITQTDPALELPREGLIQCGPVAVTNSLIRLQKNGYPKLSRDSDKLQNNKNIITELSDYMGVLSRGYASTPHMLYGIDKYIKESGYEYKSLKSYYNDYDLNTIKKAVNRSSSIWVVLRWFEPNGDSKLKYAWTGHWFTLIGYEERDSKLFIYSNDPSPYAGDKSPNIFRIEKINSTLTDPSGRDYNGYYELVDFYKRSPKERAIIIGIIEMIM